MYHHLRDPQKFKALLWASLRHTCEPKKIHNRINLINILKLVPLNLGCKSMKIPSYEIFFSYMIYGTPSAKRWISRDLDQRCLQLWRLERMLCPQGDNPTLRPSFENWASLLQFLPPHSYRKWINHGVESLWYLLMSKYLRQMHFPPAKGHTKLQSSLYYWNWNWKFLITIAMFQLRRMPMAMTESNLL